MSRKDVSKHCCCRVLILESSWLYLRSLFYPGLFTYELENVTRTKQINVSNHSENEGEDWCTVKLTLNPPLIYY